ncbi:MAG: hypothetical protein LBQ65_01290 [Tannerellaceae bacterium]|nr:hypothetical protein [Tannerellaceae bacterium]
MALQVAFAQGGRVVTIYFHNGSVIKGEISKLPNEERFKIQTPNGSVFLFTSSEVRDILYDDGTRPGGNRGYAPQGTTPPGNQAYNQAPPQQSYQQPYQQNRVSPPAAAPSRNNQVVRVEPEEEVYEEDVYDDSYELAEDDSQTPSPAATQAPKTADLTGFVPGYHGFVDFGYTLGMGDSIHAFNRMELTITQGYQFTPALYVGFGTGVHLYADSVPVSKIVNGDVLVSSLSYAFPVFVDFRYNFSNGKIRPFAALKGGYSIGLFKSYSEKLDESTGQTLKRTETSAEALGFYVSPSVGAKFMLGRYLAFNLALGYSMQFKTDKTTEERDGNTLSITKMEPLGGVTLKAGLEF